MIRKYAALFVAFFRASFTADIEFRANFTIKVVTDIFWYVAQIASFEVLFLYTPQIGEWSAPEMRVFLGVLFIVDAIHMVLFSVNLDLLSENVRKGNLDLLLTKPVNSQFMISFQRSSTAHLANLLMGLVWLAWALGSLEAFSWPRLAWLLVMIPCGNAIFYTLRFFFSTAAVIFQRAENLQYVFYHLYRLGLRPDNIYQPWLKYLVLTALPVGLIASAPARVVLGIANPWLPFWALVVALGCLAFSRWFWRLSLKMYVSASS